MSSKTKIKTACLKTKAISLKTKTSKHRGPAFNGEITTFYGMPFETLLVVGNLMLKMQL